MEIGKTTICRIKDDKKAIVTFTFDDALYKPAVFFTHELTKYDLTGTFAVTTNFVRDSDGDDVNGTWEQWKNLINSKFNVANHSKSHRDLTKLQSAELEEEINGARRKLISEFKGQKVLCMINPFNATNEVVERKISEQHFAARNGIEGYNSVDPSERDWLRLNYKGVYHNTTSEEMNRWIDEVIKNKLWLIEMIHGVDGIGWEAVPGYIFSEHFAYVSSKRENIWNATFEDATLYIRETQSASVSSKFEDQKIIVNLTVDLPSYFDYPLTLKTFVPSQDVMVISNGKSISFKLKKEEEKNFVYYDVIPNLNDTFILF